MEILYTILFFLGELALYLAFLYFFGNSKKQKVDWRKHKKLQKRFNLYYHLSSALFFVVMPLVGLGSYYLGVWSAGALESDTAQFSFTADTELWVFPAICFSFGLGSLILDGLLRLLSGENYPLLVPYFSKKANINYTAIVRFIVIMALPIGLFSFAITLDTSLKLEKDVLYIDAYGSLWEEAVPLKEITSIYYYDEEMQEDGTVEPKFQVLLYKDNEVVWGSDWTGFDGSYRYTDFIKYIEEHKQIKAQNGGVKVDF